MSLRCWMGKTEFYEELYGTHSPEHIDAMLEDVSSTCMLDDGHEGSHKWTPDNQIGVTFEDNDAEGNS